MHRGARPPLWGKEDWNFAVKSTPSRFFQARPFGRLVLAALALLFSVGGCSSPGGWGRARRQPRERRQIPSLREYRVEPAPQQNPERRRPRLRQRTGLVEALDAKSLTVGGERYEVAAAEALEGLSIGSPVLITIQGQRIIDIERFRQQPMQRPATPPVAPELGDLIELDRLRGQVLRVQGDRLQLLVRSEGRWVGKSWMILRASSVMRYLKEIDGGYAARQVRRQGELAPASPRPAKPTLAAPVAPSIPSRGPLSAIACIVMDVDAAASIRILSAAEQDGEYRVGVLLHNSGPRTLSDYTLTLELRSGRRFQFGGLSTSRRGERLAAGAEKSLLIRCRPVLLGRPKALRVLLSDLAFEE